MTRTSPFGIIITFAALSISWIQPNNGLAATAGDTRLTNESVRLQQKYDALPERIRTSVLTQLSDPLFPGFLFVATRHGGRLSIGVGLNDPEDPNTLDVNFPNWVLTARASLLLSHAKLVTASVTAGTGQAADGRSPELTEREAASRVRIAQIVKTGKYGPMWEPFVDAYREFLEAADRIVPPADTMTSSKTSHAIADLAREHGMFRLVRETPIDPGDIAAEIVRLIEGWRAVNGLPAQTDDRGPNLFYVCDSGEFSVHVHAWHRLAPSFYKAWDAVDKKRDDPGAVMIVAMFNRISRDIQAWSAKHANADSRTRDRKVNEMATDGGLYSMLEK